MSSPGAALITPMALRNGDSRSVAWRSERLCLAVRRSGELRIGVVLLGLWEHVAVQADCAKEELAGGAVGYEAKKFLETHPTIHEHTDWGEIDMLAPMVHNKSSWFGDLGKASLEDFIEYSQMAQAEVYGYVSENWRSQFPYKGGDILWTYNLHGPGSSWQIIDWLASRRLHTMRSSARTNLCT